MISKGWSVSLHNPSERHPLSTLRLRTVLQRCKNAEVRVGEESCGVLESGLMLLVGFAGHEHYRSPAHVEMIQSCEDVARKKALEPLFRRWWEKVSQLRIFTDAEGKMNQSLIQQSPECGIYLVSQFTLFADLRKGNRPSYTDALPGPAARLVFDDLKAFLSSCRTDRPIYSGIFAADMAVSFVNDGPVTLTFDCSEDFGVVSL